MKVNAEKIDKHTTVLEIEVGVEEVNKAFDRAFVKLAQRVNIPGFRKGKAPRKILETRLGKDAIIEEALDIAVPETYGAALDETKIVPIAKPKFEFGQMEENKPLIYKATVIGKPEVQLGEYKGVKVEKTAYDVSDKMVEEELATLQQRHAKMIVVEGVELKNGDFAIIDFEGFLDGVAFEGGKGEGHPLELGSGSFIPGFEEQLVGAKAGDNLTIKVTFPVDYSPELAGKDAEFKVAVKDVKRKELPTLDDDFAKEASEFETLEELKADTRNKLEVSEKARVEREQNEKVLEQVVQNASVEIPEMMVEQRALKMINDFSLNLEQRGLSIEQYMEYAKTTPSALKETYKGPALNSVKTDLVLEAIANAENIEVTDNDVSGEICRIAAMHKTSPKEVLDIMIAERRLNDIRHNALLHKAMKLIIESAEK